MNLKKITQLGLILFFMSNSSIYAEEVGDDALRKASNNVIKYLSNNDLIKFDKDIDIDKIQAYYGDKGFKYNIIILKPSGYLILSGDYEYDPIVHFSNQKWRNSLKKSLVNKFNIKEDKPKIYRKKWNSFLKDKITRRIFRSTDVNGNENKLLKTVNWNQRGTFNDNSVDYSSQMPLVTNMVKNPNGRAFAGCGTVAGGIIMNYHQYPITSPNSNAIYNWSYNRFDATLASFFEEFAQDTLATYGVNGTGMNIQNQLDAIKLYGYNVEKNLEQTALGMYAFSKKHIDKDRPLILNSNSWDVIPYLYEKGYDHSTVVDGYKKISGTIDNDYFVHINYGWGGSNNQWWKIDSLADLVWGDRLEKKWLSVAYPPLSFWTGNGSIISYHGLTKANTEDKEYSFGVKKDTTVAHSRGSQKPVGFFQWQVNSNCKKLKIDYAGDLDKADITIGYWSPRNSDVTFQNVSLPFTIGENNSKLSFSKDGTGWAVIAVELKDKVSSSARINATCTSSSESTYTEPLKKNKPILFGDDYQWNGNASIISRIFKDKYTLKETGHDWPYGVFKDVTEVHPGNFKPTVFFQWMSSDVCKELIIDAPSLSSTEKNVLLGVKDWDSNTVNTKSVTLPTTISNNGNLWNVIQVRFKNGVSKKARVEATCKGYKD